MLAKTGLAAAVLLGATQVNAFWRMQCGSPLVTDRVDPLVQPGIHPAKHVHNIMGGNALSPDSTWETQQESTCSSCQVKGDKSLYWVPTLYFQRESDGLLEQVAQKDAMLVYYHPEYNGVNNDGTGVEIFPKGFAMLAGDPNQRKSVYEDMEPGTEAYRRQMAVGFNCLHYGVNPVEGFGQRKEMPSKEEMKKCFSGLRADIVFPSCWDGRLDSKDHKSHVAYPTSVENGLCPPTHPKRLITMRFETLFDVNPYADIAGRFVWSTGDLTGRGYHGDFINGWDLELLQAAKDDVSCAPPVITSTGGMINMCNTFVNRNQLQSMDVMNQCKTPSITNQSYTGPAEQLAGCNSIKGDVGALFECSEEEAPAGTIVSDASPIAPPTATSTGGLSTIEPMKLSKITTRTRKTRTRRPRPTTSSVPIVIAPSPSSEPELPAPASSSSATDVPNPMITAAAGVQLANHPKGVKEVVVTVVETITQTVFDDAVTKTVSTFPRHRRHHHKNF